MTITYTGRKGHLTPALKEFAEEKLGKIPRFLGRAGEAHVILAVEKHRHLAEIVLKGEGSSLAAKAEASAFQDAIAVAVDRLIAQCKKQHEILARERKRRGRLSSPRAGLSFVARAPRRPPGRDGQDGRGELVRMGRIAPKPMSLEEALQQMRASRDPVLAFRDVDSQQLAVIIRRHDGRLGLVEEEG